MKKKILSMTLAAAVLSCGGQNSGSSEFGDGNVRISVEQGEEWLHDFRIFWFVKMKNSPQIAIWTEDTEGNYLSTVYVSEKIAKQSWTAAGGNRRKEALPCWSYARGKQYSDGLYLPTKEEPLPDAVTGATPKGSFSANVCIDENIRQFVVKCEFNHSTDFNYYYPKDAREGDKNYSGGKMGSGQPSVVYAAMIDLDSDKKDYTAILQGHGSPAGSNGKIYPDVSELTTALNIVKSITVHVNR